MISTDIAPAVSGPAQARGGAKSAQAAAADRPFEEFVEAEPAKDSEIALEEIDLVALLDAATPPVPPAPAAPDAAAPVPVAAALSAPDVLLPDAEPAPSADAQGDAPPAATGELARPLATAASVAPAPTAPLVAPAVTAFASEGGDAAPADADAGAEGKAEPEPLGRIPGATAAAGPANGSAEARPVPGGLAPPAFDLASQPTAAQSWRLSAVSVEAAHSAREPTGAQAPSPRDVAGQITVVIAQSTQPQLEIRLDPPELGRVQIRLTPTEHGLQALVLADRPETQEFLRRHADVLVRDLTDAGYAQVSLNFAAGGEAAPRDAPADERRLSATFEAPAAPVSPRDAPRRIVAGGLDIRL